MSNVANTVSESSDSSSTYQLRNRRFHCPKCGDKNGYFNTFAVHEQMMNNQVIIDSGYKAGDQVGYCTAKQYSLGECDYEWVRTKESDQKHFITEVIEIPV